MKYQSKDKELDSFQWDETDTTFNDIEDIGVTILSYTEFKIIPDKVSNLDIDTINGRRRVSKGDYVVKYDTGEVDILKPDEFDFLFEEKK